MTYRYILVFSDQFGVVRHTQTDRPARTLAIRVAEGLMTAKQAAKAEVYLAEEFQLSANELNDAIKFQRLVEQARRSPESIRELLEKKKMTDEVLQELREELQVRFDEELFAAPWPYSDDT